MHTSLSTVWLRRDDEHHNVKVDKILTYQNRLQRNPRKVQKDCLPLPYSYSFGPLACSKTLKNIQSHTTSKWRMPKDSHVQ